MAKPDQIELVHGAGVDTNRFRVRREAAGVPVVLTHARMLWDKGIGELVEAARMTRRDLDGSDGNWKSSSQKYPNRRFPLRRG